jgi:tetratricopeptide (TPR) repeat protein
MAGPHDLAALNRAGVASKDSLAPRGPGAYGGVGDPALPADPEVLPMTRHSIVPRGLCAAFLFLSSVVVAQEPKVDIEALRREGATAVQSGDFEAAAAAFKKITDADPKDGQAWHMLGYALHAGGKLDEALPVHIKAASFPAVAGPSTYNVACVYALKGKSDDAFAWLEKAITAGFNDENLLNTDSDLDSLRKDPRFAKIAASLKTKPAPLQAFVQNVDRKNARIAWFGKAGSPAQISLDYSPVPWKDQYEAAFASGSYQGKKWRLGSNFWTRIDTWVDLHFGDVVVPAGYYYLTLEQRDANTFVLALHDPATIKKNKIDAFQADRVQGGIEVKMQHSASEKIAKELDIALQLEAGSKQDGELTIAFGGHKLTTAFTAELK